MVIDRRAFLRLPAAVGLSAALGAAGASCTHPGGGADLVIGLTYIPDVQFAPFYVAEQSGRLDAGVTLRHHGQDEDLFGALSSGTEDVVVAGGDEMMQARDNGIDVVSLLTLYATYPVCLVVPEDSQISEPADLAGARVGVPGRFGETWFGLVALLKDAGLSEDDVSVETIGYTQEAALSSGQVEAVMGFVNNDVSQLDASGLAVRAVPLGQVPLVGISLGASSATIDSRPEELAGLVAALTAAIADITADPQSAVDASAEHIPGTLSDDQREVMLTTAEATIPLYGDVTTPGWGTPDPELAQQMSQFLTEAGLISGPVSADEAVTDAITAGS